MTEEPTQSSKHTPGPWGRSIDDDQTGWVKSSEGTIIAKVPSAGWDDTQWLNHRLIAAAPEMLEVLKKIQAEAITCINVEPISDACHYLEAIWHLAETASAKAEPIKPEEAK